VPASRRKRWPPRAAARPPPTPPGRAGRAGLGSAGRRPPPRARERRRWVSHTHGRYGCGAPRRRGAGPRGVHEEAPPVRGGGRGAAWPRPAAAQWVECVVWEGGPTPRHAARVPSAARRRGADNGDCQRGRDRPHVTHRCRPQAQRFGCKRGVDDDADQRLRLSTMSTLHLYLYCTFSCWLLLCRRLPAQCARGPTVGGRRSVRPAGKNGRGTTRPWQRRRRPHRWCRFGRQRHDQAMRPGGGGSRHPQGRDAPAAA